jgi:hypothetical protein
LAIAVIAVILSTANHLPMTTTLRLLTLALLTSSPLVLTECHKNEEPPTPTVTEREKWLTTSNWLTDNVQEEQITAAGVVTVTPLSLSLFDPCSVDDVYHYRPDRTFILEEGPLACSHRTVVPGTWEFASNETELVTKMAGNTSRYPIRILTATTLSYVISHNTQPDGTQVNLIQNCSAR